MDAARIFDVIFVLTGGGPANQTESLVIYAYKTLYRMLQFGFGSALSVATFLFVLALSLVYLRMLRHTWRLREG
jgi:multiple sugar transport system permease protein